MIWPNRQYLNAGIDKCRIEAVVSYSGNDNNDSILYEHSGNNSRYQNEVDYFLQEIQEY